MKFTIIRIASIAVMFSAVTFWELSLVRMTALSLGLAVYGVTVVMQERSKQPEGEKA